MASPVTRFGNSSSSSSQLKRFGRWYKYTCDLKSSEEYDHYIRIMNLSSKTRIINTRDNLWIPHPKRAIHYIPSQETALLPAMNSESAVFLPSITRNEFESDSKIAPNYSNTEYEARKAYISRYGERFIETYPYRFKCDVDIVIRTGICVLEQTCILQLVPPDQPGWYDGNTFEFAI